MADPVFLSFSYGAGVLSFFSPCAFPLLPAYISFYLGREEGDPEPALGPGLLFGGLTVLGMLAVFGGLGALLGLVGGQFLAAVINPFGLAMGVVLLVLGVLLLATHRLSFALPIRAPRVRGPVAFFLFGVAYALVSLGCTFPIFLIVVTGALLGQGLVSGLLVFLVYTLGLGTVMVFVTLAVATSREVVAARMRRVVPWIRGISAVVLLGVGGYMLYFYGSLVL